MTARRQPDAQDYVLKWADSAQIIYYDSSSEPLKNCRRSFCKGYCGDPGQSPCPACEGYSGNCYFDTTGENCYQWHFD